MTLKLFRRRRAESRKLHTKNASQAAAANSSVTPYASYTIPVSAAYDNATGGTAPSYQALAYDNETVGDSDHAYAVVKEPEALNNQNCYDNSSSDTERNETYSMCNEMEKDDDNVTESPSTNTENDTIVIDNELYA